MIIESHFKPAWWLPGPHSQTIWPTATRRLMDLDLHSQRLELLDGDFIDLVWSYHNVAQNSPIVILLHGLGGGINSSYARGLLRCFNVHGWNGLVMHFRGCSGEPNRLDRSYHCGDTQDLTYLVQYLHQCAPNTPLAAVGISLGGNVLLKYLSEHTSNSLLSAAVAVSVPFDLSVSANHLMQGFASYYQRYLIKKLHENVRLKYQYRKPPFDLNKLSEWQSFWEFDNYITAPLHGFNDVHDYYQKVSVKPYLSQIKTPTLIIHAKDDPFMIPTVIPSSDELSHFIDFELSDKGGHVGFIGGKTPGVAEYWLEYRIPRFLQNFLHGAGDGNRTHAISLGS